MGIFTASLPASVLFAPVVSWLIDKHGIAATLHVVNGLGCLYALAALVPSLNFQLVTFVIYTNYRALLFSAMSVYNARCFWASVGRPTAWARVHRRGGRLLWHLS